MAGPYTPNLPERELRAFVQSMEKILHWANPLAGDLWAIVKRQDAEIVRQFADRMSGARVSAPTSAMRSDGEVI